MQSSSSLLSGKDSSYMGCMYLSIVVPTLVGVLVAEVGSEPGWLEILLCVVTVIPLKTQVMKLCARTKWSSSQRQLEEGKIDLGKCFVPKAENYTEYF
ncbi:hypothetical protein E5288_WYG000681 [Bos mutus]|uniref:Uncharacterized protein n=1 Tax=Bos mutus TaxID=72004 RepID=A0A6B0QQ33_9CETA|nr:hypothetical protein [Bos mutus]